MTLEVICPGCKTPIKFRSSSNDRVELATTKGEVIKMNCPGCHTTSDFHVDDVVAVDNKIVAAIASIILVGGMIVVFVIVSRYITRMTHVYVGAAIGVIMAPFMVYWVVIGSQRDRVETFNRHKVKSVTRDLSFKRPRR
jgi:hypothetical protein